MCAKESQVNIVFPSLRIVKVLANSADSDEMTHDMALHVGFHNLPKYLFPNFQ